MLVELPGCPRKKGLGEKEYGVNCETNPICSRGQLAERGHAENEQPDQGTPARSHQLLLNSSTSVRAQATQVFTNLLFAVSGRRPIA